MMNRIPVILIGILLSLNAWGQASDTLSTRVILIGDAGSLIEGKPSVLNAVKKSFPLDEKTTVVFLGDNLYDAGLPDETFQRYSDIKAALDSQINLVKGTPARAIMIPGNHDWENGGTRGYQAILRQQDYVDRYGDDKTVFYPKNGCPGPVEVEISKDVVLVIMDSQWWLHTNDKPGVESDCEYKTEEEVISELEDILNKNFDKLVLLATHHPFRSNGPHGGYYTWKQHLFPFTDMNKNLYIPLPVLGSVYPIVRSVFGTPQDIRNPNYVNMVTRMYDAVKSHPHVIMVSGHEHNLELLKDSSDYYYVISGSGCKTNRVSPGRSALFTEASLGFATLDVSKNKNVRASFYTVDAVNQDTLNQAFSEPILEFRSLPKLVKEDTVKATYVYKDFVKSAASSQYKDINGIKRFFNGTNYRKEWSTPVTLKVFNINKEKGGFRIDGLGGGKQTKSLSLIDKNGKEWKLRTIDKDPEKAIPENFRHSFASGIIQDLISAAHPYAPMTLTPMSDAAGIITAPPEFFYVPDDPSLGYYRPLFANKVCMLEEKDPDYNNDSKSSFKLFDKMLEENDHTVYQPAVLRARLFDMLIADWDRHFDQWRFAPRDTGKGKVYIPIPRDRDQAYFYSDGFLIRFISRRRMPFLKGLRNDLPDIKHLNMVAKDFDRVFMNNLDRHTWDSVATAFTNDVNDSVIRNAIKELPPEVYAISGEKITQKLINRRKLLRKESLRYFEYLSKEVNILGSNQKELFKIEQDKEKLKVVVYSYEKGSDTSFILYSRSFEPAITQEIRLYGFNSDDQFVIDSGIHTPIRIRMIGGRGNDTFYVKSKVRGYVYDNSTQQNFLGGPVRVKNYIKDDPNINEFRLRSFEYPIVRFPRLVLGFNADDGILAGTGFWFRNFKFRKDPYANDHRLSALAAFSRKAFQIRYNGTFIRLLGKADLLINASINSPTLTNFYGFGNLTKLEEGRNANFYRVRYKYEELDALLRYRKFNKLSFYIGPSFFGYQNEHEDNLGYVLAKPSLVGIDSSRVYSNKSYLGFKTGIEVNNLNNELFPTRGIDWNTRYTYYQRINGNGVPLSRIQSDMTIYASLKVPARFVGVIKMGGGHIFNNNFEYFQALSLGQNNILRGFRKNRFSGQSLAYGSLEIRAKLFDSQSIFFPGQVGLLVFDDVGRVWYNGENSRKWHNTIGAGIYYLPFDLTIVSATVGLSEDGTLFNFSIGAKFNITF